RKITFPAVVAACRKRFRRCLENFVKPVVDEICRRVWERRPTSSPKGRRGRLIGPDSRAAKAGSSGNAGAGEACPPASPAKQPLSGDEGEGQKARAEQHEADCRQSKKAVGDKVMMAHERHPPYPTLVRIY